MTRFSAFTRFGNGARFSSRPTHGERIYADLCANVGGEKNYSLDWGSLSQARLFASAMLVARVLYTVERAGSQFRPRKAYELLPALEFEYGISPERDGTVSERQNTLAAYARVSRGARRANVQAVLSELLGADFRGYVTVDKTAAVVSHATPTDVGIYKPAGTPRSGFQLLDSVPVLGSPRTIRYASVFGASSDPLVDELLVVDPADYDRIEVVRITAVDTVAKTFTATFTKPHNAGVLGATGRHPYRMTSKRHNVVVLTSTALRSGRTRRIADRMLRRLLRGISTWSLSEEGSTPGSTGPFKVGEGQLGFTTIGAVPFP